MTKSCSRWMSQTIMPSRGKSLDSNGHGESMKLRGRQLPKVDQLQSIITRPHQERVPHLVVLYKKMRTSEFEENIIVMT